jgi:hypothetical protein
MVGVWYKFDAVCMLETFRKKTKLKTSVQKITQAHTINFIDILTDVKIHTLGKTVQPYF